MAGPVIRVLNNPSEEQLERASWVLSEAFNHSYGLSALNNDSSLSKLLISCRVRAAALYGELEVAELPGEGIVAVGVWFGPGQQLFATSKQREGSGWNDLLGKLDQESAEFWDYFLTTAAEHSNIAYGKNVQSNGFFLQMLGISTKHQNKGIGRAMINFYEQKARKQGVTICLQTVGEPNISVYKSMGFVERDHLEFVSPGNEAFSLCFFSKDP